ncbi:MAG: NAD(P)-dependent oxidoreductase [Candidatus Obscuribacterales bacterium]|nr:NAD(P)-dependent oxidoreductase [Candidatus Obscuribacterales bacterium]
MRVLLTGGSGDLGQVLAKQLIEKGHTPAALDIQPAKTLHGEFIQGSILDRDKLPGIFSGCDCIVHIADWHGIHEFQQNKDAYDFFDLNVKGTFEVFQAAVAARVKNVVFISTTSVDEPDSYYGMSKILAEQIADFYFRKHNLNVVTLRPRAFIPHWNRAVYKSYVEWAKWFWGGAVHIDDVAQAVLKSIDFVSSNSELKEHLILPIDGAYEYTDSELANWDKEGPGSTFRNHYEKYLELVQSKGLDPALKPRKLDISQTNKHLGYEPTYSLGSLLRELSEQND